MAAPLPAAAATAAPRPGPSVAAAAAVGTRRQPLLRLRSLECRGLRGPPAPAQCASGAPDSVPDALNPGVSGKHGRGPGGRVKLTGCGGCPGIEASKILCLGY